MKLSIFFFLFINFVLNVYVKNSVGVVWFMFHYCLSRTHCLRLHNHHLICVFTADSTSLTKTSRVFHSIWPFICSNSRNSISNFLLVRIQVKGTKLCLKLTLQLFKIQVMTMFPVEKPGWLQIRECFTLTGHILVWIPFKLLL